jgi:hypothetical protein
LQLLPLALLCACAPDKGADTADTPAGDMADTAIGDSGDTPPPDSADSGPPPTDADGDGVLTPEDVASLTCLTRVDRDVLVRGNPALPSLAGLHGLTSADQVILIDNPALCADEIDALLSGVTHTGRTTDRGNRTSCPAVR